MKNVHRVTDPLCVVGKSVEFSAARNPRAQGPNRKVLIEVQLARITQPSGWRFASERKAGSQL